MSTITLGEPLYEYTLTITGLTEYGVSFEDLASGKIPPPPEGARFDVAFAGEATGSNLAGKVSGIDYLHFRADGRCQLDVHCLLYTSDAADDLLCVDLGGRRIIKK